MCKQEGIPYIPEADEILLLLDAQMPVVTERDIIPQHRWWQRGCRPIGDSRGEQVFNKIIQSRVHGNCVVIHGYMYPLKDFLSGPLCKPTLEVQQRAAFVGMHDQHVVDTFHQVIKFLRKRLAHARPSDDGVPYHCQSHPR